MLIVKYTNIARQYQNNETNPQTISINPLILRRSFNPGFMINQEYFCISSKLKLGSEGDKLDL